MRRIQCDFIGMNEAESFTFNQEEEEGKALRDGSAGQILMTQALSLGPSVEGQT